MFVNIKIHLHSFLLFNTTVRSTLIGRILKERYTTHPGINTHVEFYNNINFLN